MTNDQEPDDAALVLALHRGDKAAADALIRRHGPRLYSFFAGKVGHGADVLCQAALRDGLADPEPPAPDGERESFRARLFAAARRHLLDGYRTTPVPGVDPGERSMAELEPGLSEAVAARAEARRLALALRRLPVELQIALELHHWDRFSSAELGRVLATPATEPPAAMEARLARARAQLEAHLDAPPLEGRTVDERESQ